MNDASIIENVTNSESKGHKHDAIEANVISGDVIRVEDNEFLRFFYEFE